MTRRELDALFASCMKEIESLSSEECASIREEYRRDGTGESFIRFDLHLTCMISGKRDFLRFFAGYKEMINEKQKHPQTRLNSRVYRCFHHGPPGGIRTPGLWNRNPLRYPASPRADFPLCKEHINFTTTFYILQALFLILPLEFLRRVFPAYTQV